MNKENEHEHKNKMKLIMYLLFGENTTLKIIDYNANLFYHSWLFTDKDMENYSGSLVKHPYIGLFHPYGAIHAISINNILNTFQKTRQHIHDPSDYSPENSYIYIDSDKIGKSYSVCIDYEKIENNLVINNKEIRIRVELLVCLPRGIEIKINENEYNKLTVSELICKLSDNEIFYPLFDTFEIKHLKNPYFNNKVTDILVKEKTYYQPDSLVLFRYRENKTYDYLLNLNLPIESHSIPYIDEINAKLPADIKLYKDNNAKGYNIVYEFGIIITRHID